MNKLQYHIERLRSFIFGRSHAYKQIFNGPLAEVVLEDLAHFCRATDSTFDPDPRLAAMQDGRREVWLRIQEHLQLSPEEIYQLATSGSRQQAQSTVVQSEDDNY